MFELLGTFLVSITGPIAVRVMIALGIGIISYAGLNVLAGDVIANVALNYANIDPTVMAILDMAGGTTALSIITSGLTTRVSMMAIKKFIPQ